MLNFVRITTNNEVGRNDNVVRRKSSPFKVKYINTFYLVGTGESSKKKFSHNLYDLKPNRVKTVNFVWFTTNLVSFA